MITRFLPPFLVITRRLLPPGPPGGAPDGPHRMDQLHPHDVRRAVLAAVPLGAHRAFHPQPQRPSVPAVAGIWATAVYGVFSIAYALLLQDKVELSSVLIVLAMYLFIVVMMLLFRSGRAKAGRSPPDRKPAGRLPSGEELFRRIAEQLRAVATRNRGVRPPGTGAQPDLYPERPVPCRRDREDPYLPHLPEARSEQPPRHDHPRAGVRFVGRLAEPPILPRAMPGKRIDQGGSCGPSGFSFRAPCGFGHGVEASAGRGMISWAGRRRR